MSFVCHLHISFEELCIQVFCPFLNWVVFLLLHCRIFLYIWGNKLLLSDIWFANIFFHDSIDCLLFCCFYAMQVLFSLMLSSSIFSFVSCAFHVISKKLSGLESCPKLIKFFFGKFPKPEKRTRTTRRWERFG